MGRLFAACWAEWKSGEERPVGSGGVLHTPVAVEDQAGIGMLAPDSRLQRPNGKIGIGPVGESIAHYLFV